MDVYQVLRSELLDDPLLGPPFLGSQPEFARTYVAEVQSAAYHSVSSTDFEGFLAAVGFLCDSRHSA